MGKERMGLQRRVEELLSEKEKLQAANAELQRQRDNVEDEKEDLLKDLSRKEKELERRYVVILRHKIKANRFFNFKTNDWFTKMTKEIEF